MHIYILFLVRCICMNKQREKRLNFVGLQNNAIWQFFHNLFPGVNSNFSSAFENMTVETRAGRILLRQCMPSDARAVHEIMKEPAVRRYLTNPPSNLRKTLEMIRRERKEGRLTIVAVLEGRVVACAALNPYKGRASHLASFRVDVSPALQGNGIGSAMLKALFEAAKRRGIEKIEANYMADNAAAARLYKKLGFVQEGVREGSFKRDDGNPVNRILIAKWL